MFSRSSRIIRSPITQHISKFATEVTKTQDIKSSVINHAQAPPKYVLTTLRQFPSLEPIKFQPVPTSFLNTPLRRDILWKAVVFDADNRRVGASNPKGRAEMGYSRKKLLPQKGTGKARTGDRGSPIRHDGGVALARTAPNDFTSELPRKVYGLAVRIALSDKYRKGELFITNNELEFEETGDSLATKIFLKKHGFTNQNKLLFVTNEHSPNLLSSTNAYKDKIDVIQKEGIEVKDLLNSHKLFIDLQSLEWLFEKYSE